MTLHTWRWFLGCCTGGWLLAHAGAGLAADGLQAPPADRVWPRWQARVSLPVAPAAWLQPSPGLAATDKPAFLTTGSVLGDYYFANRGFSHFRASGGLLLGTASSHSLVAPDATRGIAFRAVPGVDDSGNDLVAAAPYLGLGYSGQLWQSGVALSADVGLIAERTVISGSGARALFGNQALDGAVRELRLSPLFQVGVRYSF